jgi:hypothetical protein
MFIPLATYFKPRKPKKKKKKSETKILIDFPVEITLSSVTVHIFLPFISTPHTLLPFLTLWMSILRRTTKIPEELLTVKDITVLPYRNSYVVEQLTFKVGCLISGRE